MNRKTRVNGINHINTYIVNEITRESRPESSEERGSKEDYMKMRDKVILYNYELNSHLNLSLTELDFLYNMKADISP